MKLINFMIEMFVWSVMFGAVYAHPVRAYLDPGGGSLLIKFLLASIVGLLFVIRQFWSRITSYIKQLVGDDAVSNHNQDKDSNND